jgi:hypothetical protein
MKNKIKYGLAIIAITIIAGVSIPYITKNSINNTIHQKKSELKNNGINLKIISNNGYFDSKREILIKIEDSIKFIDYMSKNLILDIETLNDLTDNGVFLDNLSIKGTILNTNIFPKNINISLSPDELPNDLKTLMKKESIINKLIKSLTLKLKADTDGHITFITLNDIIINDKYDSVKILNPKININNDDYITNIQNITLKSSNSKKESILLYLDGIQDVSYENNLNLNGITTIDKIKFNLDLAYNKIKTSYASDNNKISLNLNSKNDELDMSMGYSVENSKLYTNNIDAKIDYLNLQVGFKGLKEQPINEIINYIGTESETIEYTGAIVQEIANYGFSMNLKANVNNVINNKSNPFAVKNIDIDLIAKLKRNNLTKNSDKNKIAKNILITGVIKMDEHIVDLIDFMQQYNTNIVNGISNFEVKFIDGVFLINNHKVNQI